MRVVWDLMVSWVDVPTELERPGNKISLEVKRVRE
jgi:hypothetical protein